MNCNKCKYYNQEIQPEQLKIIICTGKGDSLLSCIKSNNFRPKIG